MIRFLLYINSLNKQKQKFYLYKRIRLKYDKR